MIQEKTYIESNKTVQDYISTQKFNWCVIAMVDSEAGELRNWYHLAHHPEDWTAKEVRYQAWVMASTVSDILKDETNTGMRKVSTSPKRLIHSGGPQMDDWLLGFFGIAWPNPEKRLYFTLRFSISELLVGARWWKADEPTSGKPYWCVSLLLGPVFFCISRRI